jgi:hypothetical protein
MVEDEVRRYQKRQAWQAKRFELESFVWFVLAKRNVEIARSGQARFLCRDLKDRVRYIMHIK